MSDGERSWRGDDLHDEHGLAGPPAHVIEALRAWIRVHFGIVFEDVQTVILTTRIDDACRALRLDAAGLLRALQAGQRDAVARAAEAVSTNHTYFMRELEVLEVYRRDILPTLRRGEARLWSAAASSGDEAYTLAMMTREAVPESQLRLSILGTDISERQLKVAEEGVFPAQQLSLIGRERLERWFRPVGLGQYEVAASLKAMCTFRRLNLTAPTWPFERTFDVVFLRNVLFYFDRPTRQAIVERCWEATEPGGWLVTSLTEPMLDVVSRWRQVRPAIYRKDR